MIILAMITLYPFLYVVFASFSSPSQLMQQRGILFWPHGFSLKSYKAVFNYKTIWISYRNTIFYLLAGTTLNMILTCLGAYGLSRKNVLLSKPIMIMITFTMFLVVVLFLHICLLKTRNVKHGLCYLRTKCYINNEFNHNENFI